MTIWNFDTNFNKKIEDIKSLVPTQNHEKFKRGFKEF